MLTITRRDLAVAALVAGFGAAAVGAATANQPHMDKAIQHLRAAKSEREQATRNHGDHPARAIGLINEALKEVRLGKQAANS